MISLRNALSGAVDPAKRPGDMADALVIAASETNSTSESALLLQAAQVFATLDVARSIRESGGRRWHA